MTTNKKPAPVGPVDISALLADIRSGKRLPRTDSVKIYLEPDVADQANELVDRIDALTARLETEQAAERGVADAGPAAVEAELTTAQDEYDSLAAQFESSAVEFTFRSQNESDAAQVKAGIIALQKESPDIDAAGVVGTAQYSTSPKLSVQDVRDLIPVIGWQQFSKMVACWQQLVFGRVSAPKSRRPSRGPGTVKL